MIVTPATQLGWVEARDRADSEGGDDRAGLSPWFSRASRQSPDVLARPFLQMRDRLPTTANPQTPTEVAALPALGGPYWD